MGAESFDGGGREVVGWTDCPRGRALLAWLPLLVDRNIHGCVSYSTNPEPWPGFWWATRNAEISHLNSPWWWQVYPKAPPRDLWEPQDLWDVLYEAGVF
ncbi:hypothetical protein [Leptolyngbya subtilissima]|uniref:hypothetical protein n=1 Tax=Leptolyngbya subtilissima TaxID=1346803 RepID=UPI003297217A